MRTYAVALENTVFHITCDRITIESGMLSFIAEDKVIACFKKWDHFIFERAV